MNKELILQASNLIKQASVDLQNSMNPGQYYFSKVSSAARAKKDEESNTDIGNESEDTNEGSVESKVASMYHNVQFDNNVSEPTPRLSSDQYVQQYYKEFWNI